MPLDDLMSDTTPRYCRLTSHEPKEGYFWEFLLNGGGHYVEGDALFRARLMEWVGALKQPTIKDIVFSKTHDATIEEISERNYRVFVPRELVGEIKQAIYDNLPLIDYVMSKIEVLPNGG
jgi:hypothetical protein